MLQKFPGEEIITNPDAPKILFRACIGLCGGLHDRLGQLPFDLFLANQTRPMFFIRWDRPHPLETFLVPNHINWTLPMRFADMKEVRAIPSIFFDLNVNKAKPVEMFFAVNGSLDIAIERANHGRYKDIRVLRHRTLAHGAEPKLEKGLLALGETDTIHWTPTFGKLFHYFFKPSPEVKQELEKVQANLHLIPGQYSSVHCRVRHLFARPMSAMPEDKNEKIADKTGLAWDGEVRDLAIDVGTRTLLCAQQLLNNTDEPVYFFSEERRLVRYIIQDLKDSQFVANNTLMFSKDKFDERARRAVGSLNVVGTDISQFNPHIDYQKGLPREMYFRAFIDFYLAINSRCITFGVGMYAFFVAKITGTQCMQTYEEEKLGGRDGGKSRIAFCSNSTYMHILNEV